MAGFRADLTAAPGKRRRVLKWIGVGVVSIAALGATTFGLLWNALFAQMPALPDADSLWAMNREPAIEFLDSEGMTIAVRGPRYGKRISPSELPPHVVNAFLAVEDKRFYEHEGVDRLAIVRAALANAQAGETVQGASTLTQQLVKNLFLTPEKTIKRKAQEAKLAQELEGVLTKDEILELYLNRIFLGAYSFGLDAAAHRYFGKTPQELSVAEAALIAGLPQAPSRYSPFVSMEAAIERRDIVLDRMVDAGFLTPGAAARAKTEEVVLANEEFTPHMGYALDFAADQARNLASRDAPDLIVTLTIDPDLQLAAHEKLNAVLEAEGEDKRAGQAAIVVMKPDGAIQALVGGRDYNESQFNRAVQAERQPGSAFKAFVYAAALQAGLQPYTVRYDEPIKIDDWKPKNYGGGYLGAVTLSEAFAESINTVAVEVAQEVGMDKVIELARRFGVRSPIQPFPSLALGSDETNLLEMTQAYGVFATGGKRVNAYIVAEVRTSRGEILFNKEEQEAVQVYPPQYNREMVGMLTRVVRRGTGTAARLAMPQPEAKSGAPISNVPREAIYRDVAGKTGTSQDWRDALFIGFTADFIGGVWVGNDDDTPMRRVTGGDMPAHIWRDVMTVAHEGLPATPLPGAEAANALTTEAERKLAFYRSLADAFAAVEARDVKNGATSPQQ